MNITKKRPLTVEDFKGFFKLLPKRGISERSWRVSIEEIKAKNYDLKAVNPHRKEREDIRTPKELIETIGAESAEIRGALKTLRRWL